MKSSAPLYGRLEKLVEQLDVGQVLLTYDSEYDLPFRHRYAIGLLRMSGAFEPPERRDVLSMSYRVGSYWCEIVRADIEYDLFEGLRLIDESRRDAEILLKELSSGKMVSEKEVVAYATARWFDGAGKIRYRLGNYARARIGFESAVNIVISHNLWWCSPDIRSNYIRARFEESRQAANGRSETSTLLQTLVSEFERVRHEVEMFGKRKGISTTNLHASADPKEKEFLRGYSSILHNLAIALDEQGKLAGPLSATGQERAAQSLIVSNQARAISEILNDEYRLAQGLNHQARLDPRRAEALYKHIATLSWKRGQRIAEQNLARIEGGPRGISRLRALLIELEHEAAGGATGTDVDFHAYTVRAYREAVLSAAHTDKTSNTTTPGNVGALSPIEDVSRRELEMARSVRRVVAMPTYKRAYSSAVRPTYLQRIDALVSSKVRDNPHAHEDALALVEESSARELLDMMAASSHPVLEAPDEPVALEAFMPNHDQCTGVMEEGKRRRALQAISDEEYCRQVSNILSSRADEFESQFLRRPLETAPHDPDIALRLRMFTANSPGACVVRYFSYGENSESRRIGAFVSRGIKQSCVTGISSDELRSLAESLSTENAPSKEVSEKIWSLLVAPLWDEITANGLPSYLVVIPTDEIFAIPIHIASPPGGGTEPLAAVVPLVQSVSATAFVGRGRHLLKRQPVDPADELAAIVLTDPKYVSGGELMRSGWQPGHMLIAGDCPQGLADDRIRRHKADWHGLSELTKIRPEFFVYAGHGDYLPNNPELGPFLQLRETILTQYDLALRFRLPRNKLSILGACVAGQGTQSDGGEVAGFLRSLMAAGAGAIGIPLWSVKDRAMVATVGTVLRDSRKAVWAGGRVFDVVEDLHRHYRHVVDTYEPDDWFENLPLTLYL